MSEQNNTTDAVELQQKYERERDRANNALGKLTDLEKQIERFKGIDIDKLKADSEALAMMMKDKAKTSGNQADIDALLSETEKKVRDQLQPKIEELANDKNQLASKLKELTVVDGVYSKIGNKFNDDMQSFVKQIIRQSVDLNENNEFIIKDENGKPRYSKVSVNQLMTIDEFSKELEEKYPSAVKSSVPAGTKTNGTTKVSGDLSAERYLRMSPEERKSIPLADRYKLAREAVKKF